MNNDLISRSALKKVLTSDTKNEFVFVCLSRVLEKIDNAPTVELFCSYLSDGEVRQPCVESPCNHERPQGKWVPVSERLPEEEDYRDCYGLSDGCIMWQTDNGDIGFGWYYHSTKCWSDIYDQPIKTGKVIAWQPLPKPYKEADND